MRALSKPLSSPSRSEKFPPPLLRFLRSNVGSRSRGRSRSSSIFYMRSRKNAATMISTTQEPSSPKVTCIGQVRVRRAAKSTAKKTGGGGWWLRRPKIWKKIRFRSKKKPIGRLITKLSLFFRFCYCNKKVDATEDSFRVNSNRKIEKIEISVGENRISSCSNYSERDYNNNGEEIRKEFLEPSCSATPPENALMLTRCRSAPYRSSSLGGRFWGSPLAEKAGDGNESEVEGKSEEKEESSKELEKTVSCVEELDGTAGKELQPLVLMRCKSEPARTGGRLLNAERLSC